MVRIHAFVDEIAGGMLTQAAAIAWIAALTAASGIIVAVRMYETHPPARRHQAVPVEPRNQVPS